MEEGGRRGEEEGKMKGRKTLVSTSVLPASLQHDPFFLGQRLVQTHLRAERRKPLTNLLSEAIPTLRPTAIPEK